MHNKIYLHYILHNFLNRIHNKNVTHALMLKYIDSDTNTSPQESIHKDF